MERCTCCGILSVLHGGVCELCFSGDDPDDYLSNIILSPHDFDDVD